MRSRNSTGSRAFWKRRKAAAFEELKRLSRETTAAEWEKIKGFLRRGRPESAVELEKFKEFARAGLKFKEARNALKRKPYKPILSPNERREIHRQVLDLVELLLPLEKGEGKKELAEVLARRIEMLKKKHVERAIEWGTKKDAHETFDLGRAYLDALDLKNIQKGRKRGLDTSFHGYRNKHIILFKNWSKIKYGFTTPFHEAAHELLQLADEPEILAIEAYYSLKRGIITPNYFANNTFGRKEDNAIRKAISIYRLGKRKGWKEADSELRRMIFGHE